ncbi:MAG: cory-CC-star protein [Gammaproteobacteria bacterium]
MKKPENRNHKTPAGTSEPDKSKGLLKRLNDNLYEYYVAPYRRTFARAQRDEEDLFMLLVFAETLGVPNPAAYYTLELLPVVYERFHEWHKRMGMEKSPLDHVHCC